MNWESKFDKSPGATRRRDPTFTELQSVKGAPDSRLLRALVRFIEWRDKDIVVTTVQQLEIVNWLIGQEAGKTTMIGRNLAAADDLLQVLARRLTKIDVRLRAVSRAAAARGGDGPSRKPQWDEHRFSFGSQNEEDGYVLALLDRCHPLARTFVELGSGRSGGNSGMLAREVRWRGLMVESCPDDAKIAQERFGASGRVEVLNTAVNQGNVDDIILGHGPGADIDFLSLDIGSFEYWVLAGLTRCRPRLLVIGYNDRFGPERRVTVPEEPGVPLSTKLGYYGASLGALTALAADKGFRLVGCDASGANAFFVRNDLAPEIAGRTPAEAFRRQERHASDEVGEPHFQTLEGLKLPLVEV